MNGIGAFINDNNFAGSIGKNGNSHLKGNNNETNPMQTADNL